MEHTEKNYATTRNKAIVVGAVAVTLVGLMVGQGLSKVTTSKPGEYISVVDFAAGEKHATLLSEDGQAYSRGWNNLGQLGVPTGSRVDISDWTLVNSEERIIDVQAVGHTVALTENGTLLTWGVNDSGQLGNGNTTQSFNPVQITATDRFSQIASGVNHTLALDDSGRLWAWGENKQGQLGNGTTEPALIPTLVELVPKFSAIYAARGTSYALTPEGELWAWGDNKDGQIGDGTRNNRNTPAPVDNNAAWAQLAVNHKNNTVLGLTTDGWMYSWGSNGSGLLGNGADWRAQQEEENRRVAEEIERIKESDRNRKTALIEQCVTVRHDEAMEEYDEEYERLVEEKEKAEEEIAKQEREKATPSPSASPSPSTSTSPSPTPSASPSSSPSESPITVPDPEKLEKPEREDFTEDCTKEVEKTFEETDTSGIKPKKIKEPELKEGHTAPELVTPNFQVKDIALGTENAFAVDVLNRLYSWGKDANGQTGLGIDDDISHTQVPVRVQDNITNVEAGHKYAAAITTEKDLLLWGVNTSGVLMSNTEDENNLKKPTKKGSGYDTVVTGLTTVYGFKGNTVYAWGSNQNGELGIGSEDKYSSEAKEIGQKLSAISPSATGVVALGPSNEYVRWGSNRGGQFGNGKTSTDAVRSPETSVQSKFTKIAAGAQITTAISEDGRYWGWGSNESRLMHAGLNADVKTSPVLIGTDLGPITAITVGKNFTAIADETRMIVRTSDSSRNFDIAGIEELAAGDDHVVIRTKEGTVYNWSLNDNGVREGTEPISMTQVDDRKYISIAAGSTLSGGITNEGETLIWGKGSENLRLSSEEGAPVENFTSKKLAIGNGYVLATDENNVLWGWGQNSYKVLGEHNNYEYPTVLTGQKEDTETTNNEENK